MIRWMPASSAVSASNCSSRDAALMPRQRSDLARNQPLARLDLELKLDEPGKEG